MKKKFEGNDCLFVTISKLDFVKRDHEFWILDKHQWRRGDGHEWNEGLPGCYHNLNNPREIKGTDGSIYRIDMEGFEEFPYVNIKEMITKIAQKLDLLEYAKGRVYALREKDSVNLGCMALKETLQRTKMITVIHSTPGRDLYRFTWTGEVPVDLLSYEKEIKEIYERMCK